MLVDLWQYSVDMAKGAGILSGIRRDTLEEFAKRCDSRARITTDNIEKWIFRYIVEEKGYSPALIRTVKITGNLR